MENEKITLVRNSNIPFIVNYEGRKYVWAGIKGNLVSKKEVPLEVFEYLASSTSTFEAGELTVLEQTERDKELVENIIVDQEAYEANTLPKDKVIEILKGNLNKMKSELSKVENNTTKRYVLDIAREIGVSNATKQKFIKEWLGSTLSIEEIFDEENE